MQGHTGESQERRLSDLSTNECFCCIAPTTLATCLLGIINQGSNVKLDTSVLLWRARLSGSRSDAFFLT